MPTAYSYVRFSSLEQAKGGSYARQIAQARKYAQANGLILDSTTVFDRGLSAYKGRNRTTGALARFLEKVDSAEIEPGSYLLIENLDRLSREDIDSAQETVKKILRAGITIVTLMDNRVYDRKSISDPFALIQMILIASRAHEESETKSKRASAVWDKKRAGAAKGRILSRHLPYWLTTKDDNIVVIPDRVKVVQKIYKMAREGHGYTKIIQTLNKDKIPPIRSSAWAVSTVQTLLHNKAVIGECQPYRMSGTGSRRTPDGPPIKHYFPAIIEEKEFYVIQSKKGVRGPLTFYCRNLFTGMTVCGICGANTAYKRTYRSEYLVCSAALKGTGCVFNGVRYEVLESMVLNDCAEKIHVRQRDDAVESEIREIRERIKGAEAAHREKQKQLRKLMLSFADAKGTIRENLDQLIKELADEMDRLKQQIANDKPVLVQRQQASDGLKGRLEHVVSLAAMRKDVTMRIRLRNAIREVIDSVKIYPAGATLKDGKLVGDMPKNKADILRTYVVYYKDGRESMLAHPVRLSYYRVRGRK